MALSFRRAGALAAAVVATIALTPVASYAQTWSHDDTAADMSSIDDQGVATPAPEQTTADVTNTSVTLGSHWLRVRNTYTDLTLDANSFVAGVWEIKTNAGRHLGGVLFADDTSRESFLFRWSTGADKSCPRLARKLDATAHTMTLWIPAKCVGYPRWVKVGAAGEHVVGLTSNPAAFAARSMGTTTEQDYVDDAGLDGGFDGSSLALSPRVHRWS
jgi:hypothetical protein